MKATKLIFLEGLPGTGKSSKAFFLYAQLGIQGIDARYLHEVARPHPLSFCDEAYFTADEYAAFAAANGDADAMLRRAKLPYREGVGIDLSEVRWNCPDVGGDALRALEAHDAWGFSLERYVGAATDKWRAFALRAADGDAVYVADSALLQYPIFRFLLQGAPYAELEAFLSRLYDVIAPLNPALIYLHRRDADEAIAFLEKDRGEASLEGIWERDRDEPYYRDKPGGAEGFRHFLRDYDRMAEALYRVASCEKTRVRVVGEDWRAQQDCMLAFLEVGRRCPPSILPPGGSFRSEPDGFTIEIDGLSMLDPTGARRNLIPKSAREFYVERLPVVLSFEGPRVCVAAGGQILEKWTSTGTVFNKV